MLVVVGLYTGTQCHHACCIVPAHCHVVEGKLVVVFVSNGNESGMRALRKEVPELVAVISRAFV